MPLLEIIVNAVVAIIFLIYWGFVFTILYHLTRFGIGVQPKRFAAVFMLGSIALSATTLILYSNLDVTLFVSNILK